MTLTDHVGVLRTARRATAPEHPIRTQAMGAMPDRILAVRTLPEGEGDFPVRWGAIEARFTGGLRTAGRGPGNAKPAYGSGGSGVRCARKSVRWTDFSTARAQPRIRDEEDYRNAVRYVVFNPVKQGFVERPQDWPYSSIHRDRARGESEW